MELAQIEIGNSLKSLKNCFNLTNKGDSCKLVYSNHKIYTPKVFTFIFILSIGCLTIKADQTFFTLLSMNYLCNVFHTGWGQPNQLEVLGAPNVACGLHCCVHQTALENLILSLGQNDIVGGINFAHNFLCF